MPRYSGSQTEPRVRCPAERVRPLVVFVLCPSLTDFDRTIEVADAALQAAVEARTGASTQADEKFKDAIDVLVAFERDFSSAEPVLDQQRDGIASRMAAAMAKDRSRSNHRNVSVRLPLVTLPLAADEPQSTSNQWPGEQRVVEFVLFRSLPDDKPIVVLRECGLFVFVLAWYLIPS
jgi:hypothetical protein